MAIQMTGDEDVLKQLLPQFLITEKQLEDKNVGVIVADSAIESLRYRNTPELMMSIFWSTSPTPPYWKPLKQFNNKRIRPVLTVTGVKRTSMDWDLIKKLAGKLNNYGKHRCIARLDNGSKLTLHGGSIKNVKETLVGIMTGLTDAKSLTFTEGTESEDAELSIKVKGNNLYKPRVQVHPHSVALINKQKMIRDERTGRQLIDGKFTFESSPKMPLWFPKKPSGWDEWVEKYTKRVDVTP